MKTLFVLVMLWQGNAYIVDSKLSATDCVAAVGVANAVAYVTADNATFHCEVE